MLYGLLIWVIPISINIVLDAVFILVLGWGVQGSALATVICQFTSFCMCVLFFLRFTTQSFKGAKCSGRRMREILVIGLPSLIQMGSLSIISVLLNNLLREAGGTLGVNTYAYLSKIITFAVMPFTAVTQALSPIVGYNYGAGKPERVKKQSGSAPCSAWATPWRLSPSSRPFRMHFCGFLQLVLRFFRLESAACGFSPRRFFSCPFQCSQALRFRPSGKKDGHL